MTTAARRPLPWYYLVNDKPVQMIATADGGMDVLVYDFATGDFVRDFDYLTICLEHTTDVDSVDEAAFTARVDQLRAERPARMSKAQTTMTITNTAQPTRIMALLAAFDQRTSAFDHALDQLAIAFETIEAAIRATRIAGLPLPQLASALSLGAQQLAAARSLLVLTADEASVARYADAERGLLGQLDRALREPGTDAKAIGRLQEDFLEHEPADRIALAAGLHGTFLIRQAFLAFARATPAPAANLTEASFALTLARNHLGGPSAAFGPRYADYLERYTQLADQLTAAL